MFPSHRSHLGSLICAAVLIVFANGQTRARASIPVLASNQQSRAAFGQALRRITPGMDAAAARAILGEPEDIKTARDPGGISAANTEEVWRYGTRGHLTFGTLGTLHINRAHQVEFVFGAQGDPPPSGMFTEVELRSLLHKLDRVSSYDASSHDPLTLIQAVNALQRIGKDKALAAISEYLRVSSELDDPGRRGVSLVLRTLFDPPIEPGYQPVMMVGSAAPSGGQPSKTLPRFPIALVDDIPFRLVTGYVLGGKPESPEQHLEWFRKQGIVRALPLRPKAWLPDSCYYIVSQQHPVLIESKLDNDAGRRFLLEQCVQLIRTAVVVRPEPVKDSAQNFLEITSALSKVKESLRWDSVQDQYVIAGGMPLPWMIPAQVPADPQPPLPVLPPAAQARVMQRLQSAHRAISDCVFNRLPISMSNRLRLQVAIEISSQSVAVHTSNNQSHYEPHLIRCLTPILSQIERTSSGVLRTTLELDRRVQSVSERIDGREGAVCAWGERRRSNERPDDDSIGTGIKLGLPQPKACALGLICCGGGAFGSDSVCLKGKRCGPRP